MLTKLKPTIGTLAEMLFWLAALLFLYTTTADYGINVCIFKKITGKPCWGCGIGRSIHYALHGYVSRSVEMHPLGLIAVVILAMRIAKLLRMQLKKQ